MRHRRRRSKSRNRSAHMIASSILFTEREAVETRQASVFLLTLGSGGMIGKGLKKNQSQARERMHKNMQPAECNVPGYSSTTTRRRPPRRHFQTLLNSFGNARPLSSR